MADLSNLRIDSARLWDTLMEMAKIGGTPKGGCKRLTLTDLDKQGRELFTNWCEAAGCTVSVDRMGNMFARRPGTDNSLPPVMITPRTSPSLSAACITSMSSSIISMLMALRR